MTVETRHIEHRGRDLHLLGTRVVTPETVRQIEAKIDELSPNVVVLDYDETRWRWLRRLRGGEEFDLVDVIRSGQMGELNARLAMGVASKVDAPRCGVREDDEFHAAVEAARGAGAEVVFGRRPVEMEGLRAWRMLTIGERLGLAFRLVVGSLKRATVDPEELEEVQTAFDPGEARAEVLARAGPAARWVFDEGDAWLAHRTAETVGDVVVVTRSASLDAFQRHIDRITPIEDADGVPPKTLLSRAIPWLFSGAIIAAFVLGFVFADTDKMMGAVSIWVVVNMIASAIGAAAALAHPLAIVATSLSSPFVSLNPAVGAGMVGAVVQALVAPPPVRDMDAVGDDIAEIRGWWRNRLSRVLLVFVFANVSSSVGSFIALGMIPGN